MSPDLLVGAVHGPRRVHPLFFDDLLRPSDEQRIVQHQDLRVEDGRELVAAGLDHALADVVQLLPRLFTRGLQHGHLALDAIRRNREADHFGAQRQDDRATDRDAGRHADAGQAFHACFSKSAFDQVAERRNGLVFVRAVGADGDGRPVRRREQQNAHDALAVDDATVARHADLRLEARGHVDELRGRARVQAQPVGNPHFAGRHHRSEVPGFLGSEVPGFRRSGVPGFSS